MTLDDIPTNQTLTLTNVIDRLFKMAGCDPTCHCCHVEIKVGEAFELAYHKTLVRTQVGGVSAREEKDIMLCDKCTIDDLAKVETLQLRRLARWRRNNPRAGFSRLHRRSNEN